MGLGLIKNIRRKFPLDTFSSIEDIINAAEIVNFNKRNTSASSAFNIKKSIIISNLSCINITDQVIIISSMIDMITLAVSYNSIPQTIDAFEIDMELKENRTPTECIKNWSEFTDLLAGYKYTKPDFYKTNIYNLESRDESFTICIAGYIPLNEVL